MRPKVPSGEVFAAATFDRDENVTVEFYIAAAEAAPGAAILMGQKLIPTGPSAPFAEDGGHSDHPNATGDSPPKTTEVSVAKEVYRPDSATVRVLGCTALAFFGTRLDAANGTVALEVAEVNAARQLIATGFTKPMPRMRQIPLGDAIYSTAANQRQIAPSTAPDTAPKGSAAVPFAGKPLRTESQTALQVRALVKKDLAIIKSSKCSICCEVFLPFLMVLIAGLQLLNVAFTLRETDVNFTGDFAATVGFDDLSSRCPIFPPFECVTDGSAQVSALLAGCTGCVAAGNRSLVDTAVDAMINNSPITNATKYQMHVAPAIGLMNNNGAANDFTMHFTSAETTSTWIALISASLGISNSGGFGAVAFSEFSTVLPNMRSMTAGSTTLYVLLSFMIVIVRTASRLVGERQEGFREHLRIMGTSDFAYVVSAYLSSMVTIVPICVIIAVMARIVWWKGLDVFMIWLTCQMYGLSMISVAFLMPSIFSSTTWSSVLCYMVFIGGDFVAPLITTTPAGLQVFLCLVFPVFNAWYGLTHAFSRDTIDLEVSYGMTVGFFVVQIVVFTALAHYLYRVFPGKHGTPAHPLWFLMKKDDTVARVDAVAADEKHQIVMKNLKKFFGNQRDVASVDLSLSIERGEILALLGHNGAGKTTTISMLTGLVEPTEYDTATFEGLDIRTHMNEIRLNIGVCPQHDVLFPNLSARAHFELFANLRGISISRNRLDELLMFLELPLDNQPVSEYSGGMKRRVSVGSSLVGEPTVVFLDEPTTGVDEVSRQKLWELLKIERSKGTTIILTTHLMEEAEVLGNRIAIMSAGQLHSLGSAIELKAQYGSGYYLEVSKLSTYDDDAALAEVQKIIPGAMVHMNSAVEVTYFLPVEYRDHYSTLLTTFEASMPALGAAGYGLNMSTLEDVFVNIAEEDTKAKGNTQSEELVIETVRELHSMPCTEIFVLSDPGSHIGKIFSDIITVFGKRATAQKKMHFELILQLLLPMLLIVAGFAAVYSPASCDSKNSGDQGDGTWPDLTRVTTPVLMTAPSNSTALAVAFAANFRSLFTARFPSTEYSNPVLTSAGEWNAHTFTVDRSWSFDGGVSHARDTWLKFHLLDTPGVLQTMFKDDVARSLRAEIAAMSAAAWRTTLNPSVSLSVVKLNPTPLPAVSAVNGPNGTLNFVRANSTTSQAASTPQEEEEQCDKHTWALALILIVAILFQTFPAMIVINDELTRSVFDTFMAHGVTPVGYWVGNVLFDSIFTLIFPIGVLIGAEVKNLQQWVHSSGQMAGLFFYVWMYCIFQLLQAYVILIWNKNAKLSSHISLNIVVFMITFLLPLVVLLPMQASGLNLEHPGWPMLDTITPVYGFWNVVNYKRDFGRVRQPSGAVALIMIFVFQLFAVTLIALRMVRGRVINRHTPSSDGIPLDMFVDKDVVGEMNRLDDQCRAGGRPSGRPDCAVAANHVWMKYGDGKIAVKGETFGVNNGECFGLLGSNGAGKTSTMRMMQLELDPSGGTVTFGGLEDGYEAPVDVARQYIRQGVCQQHDTLVGPLSGEGHLHLYLKLRLGSRYRFADWDSYVNRVMAVAQLPLKKTAEQYSGGMKRKLAVAIAIFTGAKVVYLDEPSTGLDPFARRLLWRLITASLSEHRSMLLTTHSMDEADAVCSRISIVNDGTMKCIGSAQHLKQRYGSGYIVHIVTTEESVVSEIDNGMKQLFGDGCKPSHVAGSLRQYPIGQVSSLAATYQSISEATRGWDIDRFAVAQSNLQQVFIAFAQNVHVN